MNPVYIVIVIALIGLVLFFVKKGGCGSCGCHKGKDPSSDKK